MVRFTAILYCAAFLAAPVQGQSPGSQAGLPRGVEAQFSAPSEVSRGDSLIMTLTIRNISTVEVTVWLYVMGDASFDPIVRAGDGTILWESGINSGFLASGALGIMLSPNGERQLRAIWPRVAVPIGKESRLHITPRLLGPMGSPIWVGPVVDIRIRR